MQGNPGQILRRLKEGPHHPPLFPLMEELPPKRVMSLAVTEMCMGPEPEWFSVLRDFRYQRAMETLAQLSQLSLWVPNMVPHGVVGPNRGVLVPAG